MLSSLFSWGKCLKQKPRMIVVAVRCEIASDHYLSSPVHPATYLSKSQSIKLIGKILTNWKHEKHTDPFTSWNNDILCINSATDSWIPALPISLKEGYRY